MKKLLWLLMLAFGLSAHTAMAHADSCEDRIKGNTEYAQWGIKLRKEMLQECGSKPSKVCQQKYESLIQQQDKKNSAALNKAFPNPSENDPAFLNMVSRNLELILSARGGYTGPWRSASEVADFQYRMCKGLPLENPKPATPGARGMPPMPPPMIPDSGSVIRPNIEPAPISGGCTNYTLMGADGRTQYCQNCCYGGTCNVICY